MLSFYIYEVCELRNEVSSLKSMLTNLISNCTKIDNQITTDTLNNNNILERKIVFLKKGKVTFTIRNTEQATCDSKSFKKQYYLSGVNPHKPRPSDT